MMGLAALATAPGVMLAAGQDLTSGFNPYQLLTAGVTPAVVLLLLLTGKLFPEGIVATYRSRAEHAEEQNELLNQQMVDTVVPALTLATQVLDRLAPLLQTEVVVRRAATARTPR